MVGLNKEELYNGVKPPEERDREILREKIISFSQISHLSIVLIHMHV